MYICSSTVFYQYSYLPTINVELNILKYISYHSTDTYQKSSTNIKTYRPITIQRNLEVFCFFCDRVFSYMYRYMYDKSLGVTISTIFHGCRSNSNVSHITYTHRIARVSELWYLILQCTVYNPIATQKGLVYTQKQINRWRLPVRT